jgi:hypothetical protein
VTAFALLHSPLTSRAAWGRVGEELLFCGANAVIEVDVTDDDGPPYAQRYVASAARQISEQLDGVTTPRTRPPVDVGPIDLTDLTDQALILVAHSGAGPLVAQVAFARQAAGRPVRGYVFIDAGLPRPANAKNRLDLMAIEDPTFATQLHEALAAGETFPTWSSNDLAEAIPDESARDALVAGLRPRGLDFFTEELPLAHDWPDAPVSYLQLSEAYRQPATTARRRGWRVMEVELGHFGPMVQPDVVAQVVTELAG